MLEKQQIVQELDELFNEDFGASTVAMAAIGATLGHFSGKAMLKVYCKKKYKVGSPDHQSCMKNGILGKKLADRAKARQIAMAKAKKGKK